LGQVYNYKSTSQESTKIKDVGFAVGDYLSVVITEGVPLETTKKSNIRDRLDSKPTSLGERRSLDSRDSRNTRDSRDLRNSRYDRDPRDSRYDRDLRNGRDSGYDRYDRDRNTREDRDGRNRYNDKDRKNGQDRGEW
jgi:hypothetical protein